MRYVWQWLLIVVIALGLSACGGDGGGGEKDTTPPVITLKGDNPMVVAQGAALSDPGATATDNVDGSVAVSVSGSVDTATVGSYTLTYTAKDSAGNEGSTTRTVEVNDLTPPTFTSPASVSVPENQTDALTLQATDPSTPIVYAISGGDAASFNVDATTGVVTFKNAPDFEARDTYTFTATATDSAGNVATQSVTVSITDVPEGVLKKTGQTKSYDEDGNEVTDGSLKDDGYYQKGVTPSYTRDDAKEVVTDHITGLQWQDDVDAKYHLNKQWLTDENYDKCLGRNGQTQDDSACYDTSGDTAATYCANLTLGGYTDWRLPTLYELESIVDRGKNEPAMDTTFENHPGNNDFVYLSSTSNADDKSRVWGVEFVCGYDDSVNKSGDALMIRCVRDAE